MEGPISIPSVAERKQRLGVQEHAALKPPPVTGFPGDWHSRSSSSTPTHSPTPVPIPAPSRPKKKLSKQSFANRGRMASKPPLAPKPEVLPNGSQPPRPKKRVPPPIKPVPYAKHKQTRAQDPVGIKPSQLGAFRPNPPEVSPKPPKGGFVKGKPSPPVVHQPRPPPPVSPKGPPILPKSVLVDRRPRLDTPLSPPEPPPEILSVLVPIPALPNGHSGALRSPPGSQKSTSPLHVSRSPIRTEPAVVDREFYAEAHNTVSQDQEDQEEYTVVREVPRRRAPRISPDRTVIPNTEYSLTSHMAESRKLRAKSPPAPPPTSQDEYSCLDRPEKHDRSISPILIHPVSMGYSVLDIPEEAVTSPRLIPTIQESYGHLEFPNRVAAEAENQEEVEGYKVLHHKSLQKASATKPPPSPRTKARKASVKSKVTQPLQQSRDRTVLPAYQGNGMESPPKPCSSSSSPLPPIKPRRQRMGKQSSAEAEPPPPLPPPPSAETLEEAGYETWNTFSPPRGTTPVREPSPPCGEIHSFHGEKESAAKEEDEQQSLTQAPFLASPKCEVNIDQLLAAAVVKTQGSSPPHVTSARRDHMYDEVVDVVRSKAHETHNGTGAALASADTQMQVPMQGNEIHETIDSRESSPSPYAVSVKENSAPNFSLASENTSDLGPTLVVLRSEGVGAEKQPSQMEPTLSLDMGYTEIDILEPVPKPPQPKPPQPKPPQPTVELPKPKPKPKPKPRRKHSTPSEEAKTSQDPASPDAVAGAEDIYVSSVLIHARKEQAKKDREANKDQESTEQKTARKPLGPPRRRPPPPPPSQGKTLDTGLKMQRSHSNESPTVSRQELQTISKPTGSPKHREKGIFRGKSRSLHRTKPAAVSPSPKEEKASFDAELELSLAQSPKRGSDPVSHSPSIGKRLKGLIRRDSKKKRNRDDTERFTESVSPNMKSMTLPSHSHAQQSYVDDTMDDFGIYSVVQNPSARKKPVKVKDDILMDADSYAMIDPEDVTRRLKKGQNGFDRRKSSSTEHLYDSAELNQLQASGPQGGARSASNSPQVQRRRPPVCPPLPYRSPVGHFATLPRRGPIGAANVDLMQLYATVTKQPKDKKKKEKASRSASVESDQPKTSVEPAATPEASLGSDSHSLSPETGRPGLLSSEIPHTIADWGQEYAVVHTNKRRSSGDGLAAEVFAAIGLSCDEKELDRSKGEELPPQGVPDNDDSEPNSLGVPQNRPPKPPRSNKVPPPKPLPYYRDSFTGEVPPQSPEMHPRSSSMSRGQQLSGIRQLSTGGPPSFPPPPPPPQSSLSEPQSPPGKGVRGEDKTEFPMDHTYEVPELEKEKYFQSLQEKRVNPGADAPIIKVKETSESLQTEPEVAMVLIDEALKDKIPKQRNPHMYEMVDEETETARERAQAKPEVDVMTVERTPSNGGPDSYEVVDESLKGRKQQHVYDIVTEFSEKSPRQKKRRSRLPPKNKPPPAPPSLSKASKLDDPGQPNQSLPPPASEASPATEPLVGKRLHVEIVGASVGGQSLMINGRPQFLFPQSHSQSFIEVGQHDGAECTPSPSQSSSTLSGIDDDTDAENVDSTEWEMSSGEEEEGPHRPPRPKTYYIAQEVLTTERTFVKGLTLLHKDFRQAVQSANRAHEKPVISEEVLRQILGNVGSLLTLNSGLLNELEERMAYWEEDPRIGDILLSRAPYMKLYTDYISRFDKALKTLEEAMKKNSVFAAVVREFEAQPKCANLPLASYMLETVQRVPRYKMLLADYIKHLPADSGDKAPSENALEIISATAIHVNETIRLMDNFRKVMEVRKKLIGDTGDTLITPYRKLLKEGELLKYSRKEKQSRMFFLFSDILIYASSVAPANTTFKALKRIPLDGMRVESLDDPEMRHGFLIISTCKSFRLEAGSPSEREQWLTAFEQAIKEHREQVESRERARKDFAQDQDANETIILGNLAPPWLPDSAVSMCQLCSVPFTVTRRRHHCRACGMVFCADCSAYLAPLKYKGSKLGRVCQTCYERICKVSAVEDSDGDRTPVKGRNKMTLQRAQKLVSLPSVLREVKARDQNAQISGYLLTHTSKTKRWKKKWFMVYNLVMYEFERHEDVTAKRSITLPSYQIISPVPRHDDPLVFCLRHPGCGKSYFKADGGEQLQRWIEVLQRAVRGEIGAVRGEIGAVRGEIGEKPAAPEQQLDQKPPDPNPVQNLDQEPDQKPDQAPDQKSIDGSET